LDGAKGDRQGVVIGRSLAAIAADEAHHRSTAAPPADAAPTNLDRGPRRISMQVDAAPVPRKKRSSVVRTAVQAECARKRFSPSQIRLLELRPRNVVNLDDRITRTPVTIKHPPRDGGSVLRRGGGEELSMPPPFCGLHDDDHPAGQKAPKSVTRSCACGTERTSDWGSLATAPVRG